MPYPLTPPVRAQYWRKQTPYVSTQNLGKVQVINFWAAWSRSSELQIANQFALIDFFNDNAKGRENLLFASIRIDNDLNNNNERSNFKLPRNRPGNFILAVGDDAQLISQYNLRSESTTIILDKRGQVRHAFHGFAQWQSGRMVEILQRLINEQ